MKSGAIRGGVLRLFTWCAASVSSSSLPAFGTQCRESVSTEAGCVWYRAYLHILWTITGAVSGAFPVTIFSRPDGVILSILAVPLPHHRLP